jgi:hypothetical protein
MGGKQGGLGGDEHCAAKGVPRRELESGGVHAMGGSARMRMAANDIDIIKILCYNKEKTTERFYVFKGKPVDCGAGGYGMYLEIRLYARVCKQHERVAY